MSRNRILITAVAAALLVVCGIGIFFASNRDHAAERADEWTMQGMTLAPDGSATPCTVRIAGTSRSYLLGGRVGAFETGDGRRHLCRRYARLLRRHPAGRRL